MDGLAAPMTNPGERVLRSVRGWEKTGEPRSFGDDTHILELKLGLVARGERTPHGAEKRRSGVGDQQLLQRDETVVHGRRCLQACQSAHRAFFARPHPRTVVARVVSYRLNHSVVVVSAAVCQRASYSRTVTS